MPVQQLLPEEQLSPIGEQKTHITSWSLRMAPAEFTMAFTVQFPLEFPIMIVQSSPLLPQGEREPLEL